MNIWEVLETVGVWFFYGATVGLLLFAVRWARSRPWRTSPEVKAFFQFTLAVLVIMLIAVTFDVSDLGNRLPHSGEILSAVFYGILFGVTIHMNVRLWVRRRRASADRSRHRGQRVTSSTAVDRLE